MVPESIAPRVAWLVPARGAPEAALAIAIGAGTAAATCLVISGTTLIGDKPLPFVGWLLIPAVPLLLIGQLWMIAMIRGGWNRFPTGWFSPTRFFFGPLPVQVAMALLGLTALGFILALTAFPVLARGGTADSEPACRYPLSTHGAVTCVSVDEYQHVGATEQRLASSVLLAFFTLHAGAALGGRRNPAWSGTPGGHQGRPKRR